MRWKPRSLPDVTPIRVHIRLSTLGRTTGPLCLALPAGTHVSDPSPKIDPTDEGTDPSEPRSYVLRQRGCSPCIRELCSRPTSKRALAPFNPLTGGADVLDARRWTRLLNNYSTPNRLRSIAELAVTALPLVVLWTAAWFTFSLGHAWASLLIAIPAAGFLVRLFMIQHDCGHGTFSPAVWRTTGSAASLACSRSRPMTVGVARMLLIMPLPATSIAAVPAISTR